ncbi:hypothetical protein HID58_066729, partial [Brassica napus]
MREMKQRMSIGMNWLVLKFMVMTLILWLRFKIKAQFASMAEIWQWEVGRWKAVGHLQSHSLDKIVTSRFSLSKEQTVARLVTNSWQRVEAQKRIIWACSWNQFGHQSAT